VLCSSPASHFCPPHAGLLWPSAAAPLSGAVPAPGPGAAGMGGVAPVPLRRPCAPRPGFFSASPAAPPCPFGPAWLVVYSAVAACSGVLRRAAGVGPGAPLWPCAGGSVALPRLVCPFSCARASAKRAGVPRPPPPPHPRPGPASSCPLWRPPWCGFRVACGRLPAARPPSPTAPPGPRLRFPRPASLDRRPRAGRCAPWPPLRCFPAWGLRGAPPFLCARSCVLGVPAAALRALSVGLGLRFRGACRGAAPPLLRPPRARWPRGLPTLFFRCFFPPGPPVSGAWRPSCFSFARLCPRAGRVAPARRAHPASGWPVPSSRFDCCFSAAFSPLERPLCVAAPSAPAPPLVRCARGCWLCRVLTRPSRLGSRRAASVAALFRRSLAPRGVSAPHRLFVFAARFPRWRCLGVWASLSPPRRRRPRRLPPPPALPCLPRRGSTAARPAVARTSRGAFCAAALRAAARRGASGAGLAVLRPASLAPARLPCFVALAPLGSAPLGPRRAGRRFPLSLSRPGPSRPLSRRMLSARAGRVLLRWRSPRRLARPAGAGPMLLVPPSAISGDLLCLGRRWLLPPSGVCVFVLGSRLRGLCVCLPGSFPALSPRSAVCLLFCRFRAPVFAPWLVRRCLPAVRGAVAGRAARAALSRPACWGWLPHARAWGGAFFLVWLARPRAGHAAPPDGRAPPSLAVPPAVSDCSGCPRWGSFDACRRWAFCRPRAAALLAAAMPLGAPPGGLLCSRVPRWRPGFRRFPALRGSCGGRQAAFGTTLPSRAGRGEAGLAAPCAYARPVAALRLPRRAAFSGASPCHRGGCPGAPAPGVLVAVALSLFGQAARCRLVRASPGPRVCGLGPPSSARWPWGPSGAAGLPASAPVAAARPVLRLLGAGSRSLYADRGALCGSAFACAGGWLLARLSWAAVPSVAGRRRLPAVPAGAWLLSRAPLPLLSSLALPLRRCVVVAAWGPVARCARRLASALVALLVARVSVLPRCGFLFPVARRGACPCVAPGPPAVLAGTPLVLRLGARFPGWAPGGRRLSSVGRRAPRQSGWVAVTPAAAAPALPVLVSALPRP